MSKVKFRPFNVVDHTDLPEIVLDLLPVDGDPIEIEREMYFVCETTNQETDGGLKIGVIPLVVKNPTKVQNIRSYINCLIIAHRRIRFRKSNNICDFNDCDEMLIT